MSPLPLLPRDNFSKATLTAGGRARVVFGDYDGIFEPASADRSADGAGNGAGVDSGRRLEEGGNDGDTRDRTGGCRGEIAGSRQVMRMLGILVGR